MHTQRNYSIDILKFVAAVLVVFLHTPNYWGKEFLLPLTRSAVPLFFIISGYYLYDVNTSVTQNRIKKASKKIAIILFYSTLIYALLAVLKSELTNYALVLNKSTFFNFLFFNVNPFGFHLWYLSAYLYVLGILFYCYKLKVSKYLFFFIPILLCTDLIFGKYCLLIWGREFSYIYLRNFLFVGLPYVLIGIYLKKISDSFFTKTARTNMLIGVTAGVLISLIEYYLLTYHHLNATRDHYLGTTVLSIFLFLYALKNPVTKPNILARFGQKMSLDIYIYHPAFLLLWNSIVFKINGISSISYVLYPFAILSLTILFCLLKDNIIKFWYVIKYK